MAKSSPQRSKAKPPKAAAPGPEAPTVRRDVLPIPDTRHVGLTTYDAKDPDTSYPPITTLRPPKGAPNVRDRAHRRRRLRRLVRLRRAVQHPGRRAAGRKWAEAQPVSHHRVVLPHPPGVADRAQPPLGRAWAPSPRWPPRPRATAASGPRTRRRSPKPFGSTGIRPHSSASATRFRSGRSPRSGPFHQWPTGSGFEYFYGFIGGEANQYYPGLYEGTTPVEPPRTPEEGYTLTEDLADHAITWVRQQKALMPDKPFFMYFAPGATHAPHHVPRAVVGQVPRQVRPGLGCVAGKDLRPPEEARGDSQDGRADRSPRRDPGLGRDVRRAQAGAGPADGDLRRLPRADRPRGGSGGRTRSRTSACSTTR